MNARWVFLAVAGCGSSAGHPDALGVDAAPVGIVDLAVTHGGQPVGGVRVVFQDHASTVVSDARTDATGHASATMAAGGYATVVDPRQIGVNDIRTFAGVEPGDHLVLDIPQPVPHSFTVVFPQSASPGIVSYEVWTQCNPAGYAAGTVQVQTGLLSALATTTCPQVTDVAVTTLDASNQFVDGFYYSGPAVADGATLDLSSETYSAAPTATYVVGSPRPGTVSFDVERRSQNGVSVYAGGTATASGSSEQFAFAMPSMPQATDFTSLAIAGYDVHAWGQVPLAPVDLGGHLPAISATGFDSVTETLTWTVQPGEVPNVAAGSLASGGATWSILAPFELSGLALPHLPADLAAIAPTAGGSALGTIAVGQVPGGYATVRGHGELLDGSMPDPFLRFVRSGAAGASGVIAVQFVDFQP